MTRVPLSNFSCIIRDFFHVVITGHGKISGRTAYQQTNSQNLSWYCRHPSWSRQHLLEFLSPQRWVWNYEIVEVITWFIYTLILTFVVIKIQVDVADFNLDVDSINLGSDYLSVNKQFFHLFFRVQW